MTSGSYQMFGTGPCREKERVGGTKGEKSIQAGHLNVFKMLHGVLAAPHDTNKLSNWELFFELLISSALPT